jgi:glycosyltransferase involved in cell wall biosynthesis
MAARRHRSTSSSLRTHVMPRVTVLLTTYNAARFVGAALEGIAAQSFRDFDVVVADDGSTDGTVDIIERFPDLSAQIVTGENLGLPGNWARGMAQCQGELIAFCAGDDAWLPNNLEVGVGALDRDPEAALSYARSELIDGDGAPIEVAPTVRSARPPSGWVDRNGLLAFNYIGGHSTVIRREAVEAVGGVDTSLFFVDLDLFVRVVERYRIVFNDQVTVRYRMHDAGLSRDQQRMLRARLALLDKHLGLAWTPMKRQMVCRAYLRTAYRELWPHPTRSSVAHARRNLAAAFRLRPSSALKPINAAMAVVSLAGPLYAGFVRRLYPRFRDSGAKLVLQRVFGMAR